LSVAAMLPLAVMLAGVRGDWTPTLFALAFCLALGAQLISRWLFYEQLDEREL
jgi:DMSO reductase anchor subunit